MMRSGIFNRLMTGMIGFLAVTAFTISGNHARAQYFSAAQIYAYARANDANALYRLRNYLETQDSHGNTALCMAVIDDNLQAYNLLKQYGANSQPQCLSAALGGTSAGAAGYSASSGTFLGMGTTGWIVTGAIVAGGVGVAAAAGGGGGGGGSSESKCVHGTMSGDVCVCEEGWTGEKCDTAKTCSKEYKETCAANEYTDGSTCKSGDKSLKKCIAHSSMPNCETFSTTSDKCLKCKEGWTGDTCMTQAVCGSEYKPSCSANEYTDGSTCKAGDNVLKKCIAHSSMPNCETFSTTSDTCAVCKDGWTGATCADPKSCSSEYKETCAAGEYTDGSTCKSGDKNLKKCIAHSSMPNCEIFSTTSDTCAVCKSGWTGDICETPAACGSEYKKACAADEYTDGSTCKSGDDDLKKCIAHTPIPNCETYSATSDTCAACKSGWEGENCDVPATCGTEYKAECAADEYTDGSKCKTGDTELKKCMPHTPMPNCETFSATSDTCAVCKLGWTGDTCETAATCGSEYKSECTADEYTDGSTCKAGDNVLKKCIAHTPMPNCETYSTTSDTCAVCKNGWTGDTCETAATCGSEYKETCAADEYTDGSKCKTGDTELKKCIAHTPMPNCQTFSDTADKCAVCKIGWEGDTCETAKTCGTEYKAECAADEYTDGQTCQSGNDELKKCIAHTPMPNCETYNPMADVCDVCKDGWTGSTCSEPEDCGTGYKTECAADEYTDGETCKSGDDNLKKCMPHTPMPNCVKLSTTSDTCDECAEGWTGTTCFIKAECGSEYKVNCEYTEYTDGETCKSGDDVLKKCIAHSSMPNCIVPNSDSDTCKICKAGWEGDKCETAKTCSTEYKSECAGDEYTDGSICMAGDNELKKCIAHTPMPNCDTYSATADTCDLCKEGWAGDTCDIVNTCGAEYKVNCLASEYTDGNTCMSGGVELKKCIAHTPIPNCQIYSTDEDTCAICIDGWTGDTCETPATCGSDYKTECAADEYTDGTICKSGESELKKCIAHTPMPNCQTYNPDADTCAVCKEGWIGDTCETPATCGSEYKATCAADEYTDGTTCKSGESDLKKCMPHTPMPNCQTYSPTEDVCAVCKEGWTGDKCETPATCSTEYKTECAADEYTDGTICKSGEDELKKCIAHTPMPNCQTYSTDADTCAVCKEGWTGDTCETPATCSTEYKSECAADEYTDGTTCKSGESDLKKCIAHTPMPNCQTYSATEDVCAVCKSGWTGDTCETPATCGSEYKTECAADEYTDGTTCKSGESDLKKCIAHTPMPNCQTYSDNADTCAVCKEGWTGDMCETSATCGSEYKAECAADEYTDGTTCKSGESELKKCIAHTPMPNCQTYSDNADTCAVCKAGWTGDTCETPATCGSEYKTECAADEYTDGTTCKSGESDLKKCIAHTPMPNCQTYSATEDICAVCKEGWSGDTCEISSACGSEYKKECAADEYTDGTTCKAGDDDLKKCIAHTPMPNCQTYSDNADTCAVCKEGWSGDTCETPATCGSEYKTECAADEYTDGTTCKSGESELKKCIAHTPMPNCQTYSDVEDICVTCKTGWTGDTCETPAVCGDDYKKNCTDAEYTDGTTCQSGDDVLKKCIAHTDIPHCITYSDNDDTCISCEDGWSGAKCEISSSCGEDYKTECAADEYTDGETCKSGDDDLKKCIPHTPMPNCQTYSPTEDICSVCKSGWTGDTCEAAATCGTEYKINCGLNEYTDGSICKSGDTELKKCIVHSEMPNCLLPSADADTCDICISGWTGDTCSDPEACGDGFKKSCDDSEYTTGDTCQSGDDELKKCIPHSEMPNCESFNHYADTCNECKAGWSGDTCGNPFDCGMGYKTECDADEYTDGQTCQSGNDSMKKCIAHTPMPNCQTYSDNADTCAVCKEGWTGETCNTPATCGTEYKFICDFDEYTDGTTCQSGEDVLKKCITHTPMPNCETYNTDSDTCAVCKPGWSGETCSIEGTCGAEYKTECAATEYTDGQTCIASGIELKKCIAHSEMPNCITFNPYADTCLSCKTGWVGDTCNTPNDCGTEYKEACSSDEYTDGAKCQSGDNELQRCIAHTPMPNCITPSTTADFCEKCKEGWAGLFCENAVDCGDDYKTACTEDEYTDGSTCKSGDTDLKKCIPHTGIYHCEKLSPTSNTCEVCEQGRTGDMCDEAAEGYIIGDDGEVYVKLDCVHGYQYNAVCVCNTGYTGDLCDEVNALVNNTAININNSEISAYGMKVGSEYYAEVNGTDGTITITGTHGEEAVGMDGPTSTSDNTYMVNDGGISVSASDHDAYGMKGYVGEVTNSATGTIVISETSGNAYGVSSITSEAVDDTAVLNQGSITISETQGDAYGLKGNIYSTVTNGADGVITIENTTGKTNGIIGELLTSNYGEINITGGASDTYGINGAGTNEIVNEENATVSISNGSGAVSAMSTGGKAVNKGTLSVTDVTNKVAGIVAVTVENNEGAQISVVDSGTTSGGGDIDLYGIYAYGAVTNAGVINIGGSLSEISYGIIGISAQDVENTSTGVITIENSGEVYGMFSSNLGKLINSGAIELSANSGNVFAVNGNGTVINTDSGVITIDDTEGEVRALMVVGNKEEGGSITNNGSVTITDTEEGAFGIWGTGISITGGASSQIKITGSTEEAAGIYAINSNVTNKGKIDIKNVEDDAWGIYSGGSSEEKYQLVNDSTAEISVDNVSRSAYGIYSAFETVNKGKVTVNGAHSSAVGIDIACADTEALSVNDTTGEIVVSNVVAGQYREIKGVSSYSNFENRGSISMTGNSGEDNLIYGIYGQSGTTMTNASGASINLSNNSGTTYGMFASYEGRITNAEGAEINISGNDGTVYGMYAQNGSSSNKTIVNNAGTITISSSPSAYGIYSEGSDVIITNTGTIIINGDSCSGSACKDDNKFIKLNGATFNQSGILQSNVIKLDDYDGAVVATQSSKFIADDISGKLELNSDIVKGGFENTYTVNDMIKAENTSALNMVSGSAMFDATLADNGDAVMSMKAFEDVVQDKSLAEFLKQNYAGENNESLYNELKKQKTVTALNDALKDLTGSDVFSRFTFEDMTMMRELNMDMNNTLFNNEDKHLETSGSITPLNFDGNSGSNARYALYNNISGRKSAGFGFAFSDVRSNNGKDNKDTRQDQTFMVSTPFGYRSHGFKFITSPRFGYSYGTYSRDGYEGKNYDGKVEKRIFGLMNEVRYPISFGKWSVAPSAEFNMLGYNIRGHEDAQRYSLRIKSQNNYSVESGLGIYANREMKPTKNSVLKLNVGMAVYHEFADPYKLELGMSGMDGTYKVRDERRKDDRAVVRSGFDYSLGKDWSLIGSVATFLDGTTHNNANLDFKCNF